MRKKGFTLIELLLVVAICTVLAAVVLPVFMKTRETARQAACLSNMRKIASGLTLYVQSYDGTYPISGSNPYENIPNLVNLHPYTNNDQIWICPSGQQSMSQNIGFNVQLFRTDEDTNYFYNTPATLSNIVTPAECILGMDTISGYYGEWPNPPKFFWCPSTISTIADFPSLLINICHNEGSNILFADGHATRMSGEQIIFHGGQPTGPWNGWLGTKGGTNNWFDRE